MTNIFDEPPAGTPAPTGSSVATPATPAAGTPPVVVVATTANASSPRRGFPPAIKWALVVLVAGILILGSMGLVFPLSDFIDPIFGTVGNFVVITAAKSSSISLGYLLIAWTLIVGNLAYMAGRR